MKRVTASCASSSIAAAPAGSESPSIMSWRFSPSMAIVIWQGTSLTPSSTAIRRSSPGLATECSFASFFIIAGPAPAKFIFPSFRCSTPGWSIIATIFCIQFSPVIRTSSLTSENRPQNVKKIVVCIPIAAPAVARIICGHTLSRSPLHAMITSFLCACSSCSCTGTPTVASSTAIELTSLLADHEAEHAALLRVLEELVAGRRAPRDEVGHRSRIGRERLDQFAGGELLDRLGGLDDRKGAGQSLQIQRARNCLAHSVLLPLGTGIGIRSGRRPCGTTPQYMRLNSHLAECQIALGCGGAGGCS